MLKNINASSVNQDRLSPHDWLTIFPEARTEYILPKISELESEIAALESVVRPRLQNAKHLKDGWFVWEIIKIFDLVPIYDLKHECQRFKRYLPVSTPKSPNWITEDQIQRAREFPILQVAEQHITGLKRCGKTWKGLCPFHDENTPSFCIYPDSNSCHCYGCGAHFDIISLAQKLLSLTFVETVKHLSPYEY